MVTSVDAWSFELAEDVDIPGWVFVPEGLTLQEHELWLREVTTALCEFIRSGEPEYSGALESEVRSVLEAGLAARARSSSYAMYQVWPVAAPAATMCHVNLAESADIPWDQMDGTRHEAHARYIGPGVQYSTRREVDSDDGPIELTSVHFIFDDGDVALILHLEESLPLLISQSLVRFTVFKDAIRLDRGDGTDFASVLPPGTIADDSWPSDDDGES